MPHHPAKRPRRPAGLMVRDALTGVYAKVALLERLEEEVHRGQRYGEPFSVVLLDLDHFKSVNDAFGHARGDATLTEFVARVQSTARNSDVLFRYGGDEFVLFLPRTSHQHAAILAERLVAQIASTPFAGHPPLSLTVSAGLATLPDDGSTAEELLARADARMYEAKREGRARVVSVDPTRDAELLLDEGSRLIERLDALDRANRFFDTLPSARGGVLRIVGSSGAGRSRVTREMEKLAGLRGHRVISITGQRKYTLEPLAALREASPAAAALPPTLVDPAEIAEALRKQLTASASTVTTITVDNVADVDRPTLEVVRALLAGARGTAPIGLIHTSSDTDADPAPADIPLRDTIELRALSRDGVRAWMRSLFRWEPPIEFIDWLHHESNGLPGSIRRILLSLVERRVLVRDDGKWSLTESFHELHGERIEIPLPRTRGVLPPQTSLIGREGALRQLLRLLRTAHLVTVVGPDGSGKSRLALEAALEAAPQIRDGVAFVSVGECASSLEVASAIATVLEIEALDGANPWIGLARALRSRRLLVVLDGSRQLPGLAVGLDTLLRFCPDVRILVTANSRVQLEAETVFHLDGLRVPKWPDPERARGFSAVQLFVERAVQAYPHFAMGEMEAPSVSRICQLLDGSPLAIEIAAAQTATMSCREIVNDLESALEAFTSFLPATPPDQQRFRAIMDQVWRMLSEEERSILRRAAVFVGPFNEVAATKVTGGQPAQLNSLVARALLLRNADGRFELHTLVRDYALQKLDEFSRDRVELTAAYTSHFLDLAREAGSQLRNEDLASSALAQLELELPNIRRAWTLALADRDFTLLMSAARGLSSLFEIRQRSAEAEALFGNALEWIGAEPMAFVQLDDRLTAFLLARHGAHLFRIGRIEEARHRLTSALAKCRRLGMLGEEAFCLSGLALVEQAAGNPLAADQHARAALACARQSADPHVLARSLYDAALVAVDSDALQLAIDYLIEACTIEVSSMVKRDAWRALIDLAEQCRSRGNSALAATALLRAADDPNASPEIRQEANRALSTLRASGNLSAPLPVPAPFASTPPESRSPAPPLRADGNTPGVAETASTELSR